MHRRHFVSAASLAAAGLSTPSPLRAQAPQGDTRRDVPRHAQDAWYDTLPSKHRLFVDSTTIAEAGNAIGFAFNFLNTSRTGYNLKDSDQGVIVCLRHDSTEIALSNEMWHMYGDLQKTKYKHPFTGKHVKGTNVFRAGSRNPDSLEEPFTLEGLARRGVHFAICGLAMRGMASMFAGKGATHDRVEQVMDDLVKSLPSNAHVMASGILAAQRAGEYGYTVLKG